MGITHIDARKETKGELGSPVSGVLPSQRVTGMQDEAENQKEVPSLWTTQVRIPSDIERLVRQESTDTGDTLNTILVKRLQAGYEADNSPNIAQTLETAAFMFLELLDTEHQRIILENVEEHKRTVAEYLISAIMLAHEQGNTSYLMPDAAMPPDAVIGDANVPPSMEATLTCEYCQKEIEKPYKLKQQRYCHDPEPILIDAVKKAVQDYGKESEQYQNAMDDLAQCPETCGKLASQREAQTLRDDIVAMRQNTEGSINLRKVAPKRRAQL